MSWLLRDNWIGSLLAFLLGAGITWYLLDRRPATATPPVPAADTPAPTPVPPTAPAPAAPPRQAAEEPTSAEQPPVTHGQPAAEEPPADAAAAVRAPEKRAEFSQLMDGEPTLFDHIQPGAETGDVAGVPPGRYGEGSADAVPHQGPPDGFTIKGNAQSMLFHTPDSPYYGRTKPEVWFRTEADAERAGFTKYARRPRKAADPRG